MIKHLAMSKRDIKDLEVLLSLIDTHRDCDSNCDSCPLGVYEVSRPGKPVSMCAVWVLQDYLNERGDTL